MNRLERMEWLYNRMQRDLKEMDSQTRHITGALLRTFRFKRERYVTEPSHSERRKTLVMSKI